MKIYLLDLNNKMTNAWKQEIINCDNVEIVNDEFSHFVKTHNDLDCIVSPANSFGIMTGGYDGAITRYFGTALMHDVQKYIKNNFAGCQPVGSAFIIKIPNSHMHLIHCPTMVTPSLIKDLNIVYKCTKATLDVALANNIKSIVLPAFGGLTGGLQTKDIAIMMLKAIKEIKEIKNEN